MKTILILLCLGISSAFAQQPTQTVRGKVFDSESQFPLVGVKVQIFTSDSTKKCRAVTDFDGEFKIPNIPVGKHELTTTILMYDVKMITIEVNSGKETIVQIPMTESFIEQEAVVVTGRKKGQVINELALISSQQFSVSETDRYPGSRSDPARMASNFAGVGGADDSRNDIVIRGNSPLGVVWRVEGVDIPNPSHFSISGSTGGPVSILNNKILANSDFFMSAFPAEYGNSTSGVFDLKLRKGNDSKHEFTGQFGFLGTELMAEGPMSKDGKSSYLVMGRYSTLSLFSSLGIKIGTDAVPTYGDGAFKFNWKLKNGGALSLFAIGGASDIAIEIENPGTLAEQLAAGGTTEETSELYGEGDRDQFFGTAMAVTGLTYKKPLNEKTFLAATLAYSYEQQKSNHDFIDRTGTIIGDDSIVVHNGRYDLMAYAFKISKGSGFFSVNHKINKKHLIKAGINFDAYFYNMHDSVLEAVHTMDPSTHVWDERWDYEGASMLVQPFVQWKWRMTEKMAFTAGIHNQFFSFMGNDKINMSVAEPRIGWKLKMKNGQAISAGAGMHSMTQPMYTYLYHQEDTDGEKVYENIDMDFSKSLHTGVGYEKAFKKSLNLKMEAYYQHLYNIPVTVAPSAFSLINMGSGFQRFFPQDLQNSGTGTNYGAEITLQKYFDKSFFFMFSGTVFNSTYVASDNIERSTSYNGNYIFNLLAGKEWKVGEKQSISLGFKATVAGGKLYGTVDTAATNTFQELIYLDEGFNSRQFPVYYRIDAKINWKFNAKKVTHEIGLDLVNVTARQNLLGLSYAPNLFDSVAEPVAERYQLGFLPLFYYKIDFRFGGKK
ncbi:TonB-dependent receptor [Crocinitomicaceae bacterium]|nr:TonB-dependent receptor [Crocinitomicaceae bacterium]MDC1195810.1 TonB-dependent receptor [Crocinitomicaceae bacterium]